MSRRLGPASSFRGAAASAAMTSIACGVGAAACWAAINLTAPRITRDPATRDFAFWFTLLGFAIALTLAIPTVGAAAWSLHDLLWLLLAGAAAALSLRLLAKALTRGVVGLVGPIMSLEGAIAAALTIVVTGRTGAGALAGMGLCVLGGAVVAGGSGDLSAWRRSSHALPAALFAGVSLWAFTRQSLPPLAAFAIMRGVGAAALLPATEIRRAPRMRAWLMAVAALDVVGNVLFLVGSRGGSAAVTAIIAGQFGTMTAVGGALLWRESFATMQVLGLLALATGVALIALVGA